MYFLQLESWLGLNVFLFLFCSGLPNLYFLSIWRSQCYAFFLAGDREQRRGRAGTENRALFCALMSSGNTFWPPQTCAFPTGAAVSPGEGSRRAFPPAGQHAPAAAAHRGQGPVGHERGSAVRAGRGRGGALPCAAVLPSEPCQLPPRAAALLPAVDSSLGPRPTSLSCQVKKVKPVHTKDLLANKGMLPRAEMRSGRPRQSMLNRKGKKMHTSHSPCTPDKQDKKTRGNCHGEG